MLGASEWVEARNTARHPIMGRTAQIKSQPNIIDAEKLTAEIVSPGSRLAAHRQTCQRNRETGLRPFHLEGSVKRRLPRLCWGSVMEVGAKGSRLMPASHTCPSCAGLNGAYSLLTFPLKMLMEVL